MDKQTTIAFVVIGLILVVWLYINSPEPQPPKAKNPKDTTLVKQNKEQKKQEIAKKEAPAPKPAVKDTVSGANELQKGHKKERVITIETDLALYEMTSRGARIRKVYLKKYKTWYHNLLPDSATFYQKHVQLINDKNGGDFNLVFVTKNGHLINTKQLDFESNLDQYKYKLSGKDSLVLAYTFTTANNEKIKKIFVFRGNDYALKADIDLENMNQLISSYRYDVEWENGINFLEKNSKQEATYSNASAYSGGEQVVVDASSAGNKVEKSINGKVDWIGIRDKYFTVIISPDNPSNDGGATFKGEHILNKYGDREFYTANLKIPFKNLNHQKDSFELYLGPIEYNILKSYGRNFQAIFDFGSFFGLKIITRPISEYILLPLFNFLHLFIPNWGWVIVVFSIVIKLVLYPLTRQSYKSMRKMQLLQPKIKELKEKYKDDSQKVQKETMKLYSTYGINPAGGCLPTLLQMPILFALFTFFRVAIEIRQEPFILWITNLSSPDVIYHLSFKLPLFGINQISGLAVLLGIMMFIQQKMSIKDPSQKAMVYVMPIVFTLMFMGFSAGLNLYYLMFNVLTVGQQYFINHEKSGAELIPVKNPKKKKGGFMQKMMEAAEQQQAAQKKGSKKKR